MYFNILLLIVTADCVSSLVENGENVKKVTTYSKQKYKTSCGFLNLGRCTRYRKKTHVSYVCHDGWKSTDDIACPHALCDGKINPDACNINYPTSYIIYNDGTKKLSSGGKCVKPNECGSCNKGFFPKDKYCRMCKEISKCNLEECTTDSDQKCTRCEGVTSELPGHRAYVANADRTKCIQACSWRGDSTWCYPGICQNEYASNCKCSDSFGGENCQTISAKPNINYNIIRLTAANGDTTEAPLDINSGPPQDTSWSNILSPSSVFYKFTAEYRMIPPDRHAFIEGYSVGITSASVEFDIIRGGVSTWSKTVQCGNADRDNPDTDLYTCEGNPQGSSIFSLPLQHMDRIKFSFLAKNGGYVKVRNKENNVLTTHYYNGATQTHSFTLTIDLEDPYHCTGTTACTNSMLTAPNFLKQSTVTILWSQWIDDASGIDDFTVAIFELHSVGDKLIDKRQVHSSTFSSTTTTYSYTLSEGGVYSVVLSAYDKARNHKSARRIFIYDDKSAVSTLVNSKLKITTASDTAPSWQTTSSRAVVDWTNRYVNSLHHNNNWLSAVAAINGIDSVYDDNEGGRTVAAISNVQAIVRFDTSFKVDHSGGSTMPTSPADSDFTSQGLSQSQTISPELVDGDTLRFWVRAYDIMSSFKEESVTVHIDTSPPVIDNLWLTRGDRFNITVHRIEELNEMTIEWIAYDEHSGLETVSWKVVDKFEGRNIVHGLQHLHAQGDASNMEDCQSHYSTSARRANCYCTPYVGCYHRHYQVKPGIVDSGLSHGGIFSDKSKGVHDSDYHIEITVTNHAKLTTTKKLKITIDTSPPHSGTVHDGPPGQPDVDYQESLEIRSHWEGFFDRESGVKFYQYKFGLHCLSAAQFGLDDDSLNVTETYSTSASWTAPSVGTYHVTVVAYNRALEASDPVCSDGITIDSSLPSLSEVAVANSRVVGGLVKTSDDAVWVIGEDRTRTLIPSPDTQCREKGTIITDTDISLFPQRRSRNDSQVTSNYTDCSLSQPFATRFIRTLYLYKENHLYVNWTGSDSESGIYDYEVGLMSDPSGEAAPDILPYTSTHHHPQYQGYHHGLSEGQRFYIGVKAINKAGLSATRVVGPVIVHTMAPVFTGIISVTLNDGHLVAQWTESSFTDPEETYLSYQFAVGTAEMDTSIIPFTNLKSGGGCTVSSSPTCTAVSILDLHWDLHHSHTYFVSIRVTNLVGLSTVGVSQSYVHYTRLPSRGVVMDVCPEGEETLFELNRYEDTDHQISKSTLTAKWHGFDNGLSTLNYSIGIGSEPLLSDVEDFVSVGSDLKYVFSGINLQPYKKYFVTVVARSEAGTSSVASDGVTVIEDTVDVSDVSIRDGLGCHHFSADYLKGVQNQTECTNNSVYQVSTSVFAAHWTRSDASREQYPDVYWSLEKHVHGTAALWVPVKDYESVRTEERILTSGVPLEPGYTYRAAVKFCAVKVCSMPIYSDGVTVIPNPPEPGSMTLKYEEIGDKSMIQVTMAMFKDPDIPESLGAYDVMDRYEWGLTDNSHDSKLLIRWQEVETDSMSSNGNKISFTLTLPGHLSFAKCRRLSVRGYNKVGSYTVLSEDIKNCKQSDPALVLPPVVMDAIGQLKDPDLGKNISIKENGDWLQPDVDYTPYKNILSAVWPTLRHGNYKWGVVSGDNIDPISHYKRANIMTVSDPCNIPGVIKCGSTVNEYVNVEFDAVSYLQHGKKYHICVHADEMNSEFEKWTAQLAEVNVCSDGIVVDLTAPEAGKVTIGGLTEDRIQVSTSEAEILWSGFTDVEEENAIFHTSGISHYQVALGTVPFGEAIMKFSNIGLVNHVTLHNLHLQSGSTVYASVRAIDFVNKTAVAVSDGFLIDSTPPVLTGRQIQIAGRYITSRLVHVCYMKIHCIDGSWADVFEDEDSGLKAYMVALGTRKGYDDISKYTYTDQTCADVDTSDKTEEGHSYYISVKGYNKAGLYNQASSSPLTVSLTPPLTGYVYDGRKENSTADNKDRDFVVNIWEMGAHWEGFDDPYSLVTTFRVKVGTCPRCDDKLQEFETGSEKHVVFSHVPFLPGEKYFTTVTACSAASLCIISTSDGVILDITAPIKGKVDDGTGDNDINFQASRTFLGCKWRGFYDAESELDHFEWRVGISPGGDEILTPRSAALEEVAFHTLPHDQQLPVGQRLYTTVRAYNKAGSFSEATSNGWVVDDTVPAVVTTPVLNSALATSVNMTSVSTTTLSVQWEFRDNESYIGIQYLSISSRQSGDCQTSTIKVPGLLREYTYTGLELHDGSLYNVRVTACNMAELCTTADTGPILVDGSKPQTGTLAIETEHAARLSRHQPGWMTWTVNSLSLAWLGFSDLHSGVDSYIITLGSKPFGTDLNKDSVPAQVFHDTGGMDKQDEGVVQTTTVSTNTLTYMQHVFVTIWAVNGVGLKSDPYHGELILEGDNILWLVRRCQPYNCAGHCVCAGQDKSCDVPSGCVALTNGGPNNILSVSDTINLNYTSQSTDVDFSPLNTLMAASWAVTKHQGMPTERFEYSIGECGTPTPNGVFSVATERVWFDAGQDSSAIITLPKGKHLLAGLKYCFFVRAWYDRTTYSTFISDGVTIDVSRPSFTQKLGKSIKELKSPDSSKDTDFQNKTDTIYLDWTDMFLQGHSGILQYKVFTSTVPGGHSIHESGDLTATSYTATSLSLEPDTVYYSSVVVYNKAGLVNWAYSDGVQVDDMPPLAGVVQDGTGIHDSDYQKSADEISSSWYGFSDSDSTITEYHWCVGANSDPDSCSVIAWQNTGLHTSSSVRLNSSLPSGTTVWSKVYAVDAVGQKSVVIVSDGVTIDTSTPDVQTVAYLGENLLQNPSFESDAVTGATTCNSVTPTAWTTNTESCVKIISPETPLAKHENTFVSVSGIIQQTVLGLQIGRQYKLSLHTGYPLTVSNSMKSIDAIVEVNSEVFTISLDPNLCHGTCVVGNNSVILWNKRTFRFTAVASTSVVRISTASRTMELVLDDVSLQTVGYISSSADGNTESHLTVHSMFLAHWSSVQASWHFLDTESPIVEYRWAIGTVNGGTQLQAFTNVGRHTQSAATDLLLTHKSKIYITIMATNAAGMTSVSYSDPIIGDMTAPEFADISDGTGADIDYQSSSVVSVSWVVRDSESGIQYCEWAIGRTRGQSDVKNFQRVPLEQSFAQGDISDILGTNPVTVYTTVRCYNKAGLIAAATTDGVMVISVKTETSVQGFVVLKERQSEYAKAGICHQNTERLRIHWDQPVNPLKSTVAGITGGSINTRGNIPSKLDYTYSTFSGLKLINESTYKAFVYPEDVLGIQGTVTSSHLTVHGPPPKLSVSENVFVSRDEDELTVSWAGLFHSQWSYLFYEIQVGTVLGGTDIVEKMLIKEASLKLTLSSQHSQDTAIYVSITAIDPCGFRTAFTKKIKF